MKLAILNYTLWLYTTHIQEDWDDYTKAGKIFIYPFWVIRSLLIWLTFPLWIPVYQFHNSKIYKHYQEFGKSMTMEEQLEMAKKARIARNQQRNQFLANKKRK